MVVGGQNGLRIPRWFLAMLGAIAAIVTATVAVINDRAAVMDRMDRVELRQCAVLTYLAQHDSRFDSPVFRKGCP